LFHGREGAPFAEPLRSSNLGDIDTGRCYRRTHEALVRNPGVDMVFPCIAGMDKTHIDSAGRMQMEPLTVANGLLIHAVRSQPSAMRILGYINHSSPAHKPDESIDSAAYRNEFIRRLADWPASWDSIIASVYQDSKRRAPSPEPRYDGSRPAKHTVPLTDSSAGAKPSRKRKPTKRRW
jgi:hypothetical protein